MQKSSKKNKNENQPEKLKFSFFPGCSLKAAGHENTNSMNQFCDKVNIELQELEDWNCCGSSSAHSIDHKISEHLPMRNISLAPEGIPLLITCPSCTLRIKSTYLKIKKDKALRDEYENQWGRAFDDNLEIVHFFEIFHRINLKDYVDNPIKKLKKIKVAPYYGCMLSMPPDLRFERRYTGLMEDTLSKLGADIISYGYEKKCCGTYLSVARPEIAQKSIDGIIGRAIEAGAQCIVTPCAMCHLNLEIRCAADNPIPILHFTELLAMAVGIEDGKKWFSRHIIDPEPVLKECGLIPA